MKESPERPDSDHEACYGAEWMRSRPVLTAQFSPERAFLYGLVRLVRPARMIEIGVSRGYSTMAIATALRDNNYGQLIAVDNWSRAHGGQASSSEYARTWLTENNVHQRVCFVGSDSLEFLREQKDKSAEIVWVDGNHDFEHAKNDVLQALRVASEYVLVHDTQNLEEVTPAVRAVEKECGIHGLFLWTGRGFWLYDVRGAKHA